MDHQHLDPRLRELRSGVSRAGGGPGGIRGQGGGLPGAVPRAGRAAGPRGGDRAGSQDACRGWGQVLGPLGVNQVPSGVRRFAGRGCHGRQGPAGGVFERRARDSLLGRPAPHEARIPARRVLGPLRPGQPHERTSICDHSRLLEMLQTTLWGCLSSRNLEPLASSLVDGWLMSDSQAKRIVHRCGLGKPRRWASSVAPESSSAGSSRAGLS